jgi:hypothetical protein
MGEFAEVWRVQPIKAIGQIGGCPAGGAAAMIALGSLVDRLAGRNASGPIAVTPSAVRIPSQSVEAEGLGGDAFRP